jgi:hypothetical protein
VEPERKIEKWLRGYARKRRGQAGDSFTLDPATRRLLHNEISRNASPSEDDDETLSLWEVLRRNWAFLLGFAACIFLLASLFLPKIPIPKSKANLGQSANEQSIRQIAGSVRPSMGGNTLSDTNGVNLAENVPAPGAPEQPQAFSRAPAPVTEPPAISPSTPSIPPAAAASPAVQNSYVNTIQPPMPCSPVLRNFEVSQNGNSIRVVDGDGSVYIGTLQAQDYGVTEKDMTKSDNAKKVESPEPAATDKIAPGRQTVVGELDRDQQQKEQSYTFRVDGMNRTLKQNVVFTATLLKDLSVMKNAQMTFGMSANAALGAAVAQQLIKSSGTNPAVQLPWSNLRISGMATVNQTNQMHVNALPAQPARDSGPSN